MGAVGDILGRTSAMRITLGVSVLGAVLPSLACGSSAQWYAIILVGRFILGFGIGGIYPLSAVGAAESGGSITERSLTTAWSFFWQIPGAVTPYLCAVILDGLLPNLQLQFRIILALGAAPAIFTLALVWGLSDANEFTEANVSRSQSQGLLSSFHSQPYQVKKALAGTCLTWFLYDVAAYGTMIFIPRIIKDLYAGEESAMSSHLQGALLVLGGAPGCMLSIILIPKMGLKSISTIGFLVQTLAMGVFAAALHLGMSQEQTWLKFATLSVVTCSLSFGPSVSTFIMPAVSFPAQLRSTFHGLSAMAGKLGALAGTFIFVPMETVWGLSSVVVLMAIASVLGCITSQLLLPEIFGECPESLLRLKKDDVKGTTL
jgi:PHS family inorganic phosphate transporter-like MFS transporter